jgi:hypothetical protein
LKAVKVLGVDGHHATIICVHKIKLPTQIMPQAGYLGGSNGQKARVVNKEDENKHLPHIFGCPSTQHQHVNWRVCGHLRSHHG